MHVKPLEDRVLLKPVELREERTRGGLYLPETSQEGPVEAEVVAVGQDESIPVKVGDHVLIAKFAGTEVRVNGVQMLLVSKSDLLAIVEPEQTTAGSPVHQPA
ncbi:MAG: co-chaperone GroES [Limnochordales bacterium]|nr:co-chaperone GroES [Limnochordales bacterium]